MSACGRPRDVTATRNEWYLVERERVFAGEQRGEAARPVAKRSTLRRTVEMIPSKEAREITSWSASLHCKPATALASPPACGRQDWDDNQ
jgi:hypothetical protein